MSFLINTLRTGRHRRTTSWRFFLNSTVMLSLMAPYSPPMFFFCRFRISLIQKERKRKNRKMRCSVKTTQLPLFTHNQSTASTRYFRHVREELCLCSISNINNKKVYLPLCSFDSLLSFFFLPTTQYFSSSVLSEVAHREEGSRHALFLSILPLLVPFIFLPTSLFTTFSKNAA